MKKCIYVSSPGDQSIKVLDFFQKKIKIVQEVFIQGEPQPIYINTNSQLMYVGIRPLCRISTFKILSDGIIKKISKLYLPTPINYIYLCKTTNLLLCSSYHGSSLIIIEIDKNGIPKKIINIFKNINGCHCSKTNYLNKKIFSTALKSDTIYVFNTRKNIIQKCKSTLYIKRKEKTGPRHITFHPNQKVMFCINELNGTIDSWDMKEDKYYFKHIQNIKIFPEKLKTYIQNYWSAEIQITSCGLYLYVSERISSMIALFSINQKDFKIFFKKSFSVEQQPRSFHIDSKSKYLSVLGEKSNFITIYQISSKDGTLLPITRHYVGINPIWTYMNW